MSGDVHVRFYEGLGVKFPGATHQARSGHYEIPCQAAYSGIYIGPVAPGKG